jgi:drug/metabolite transporter (DMT)-like permease
MLELAIFILLCLIWGSTWLAIKIGLSGAPPFLGAGIRFAIAAIVLYLFLALTGRLQFSFKRQWPAIIMVGIILYPLPYGLVYWGEQYTESGMAAVLFGVMPFFVAIMAHLLIKDERLTFLKIAGMIFGFSGLFLIFADSLKAKGTLSIMGMAAIALSSFFSGLGTVMMKKHFHDQSPVSMTAIGTSLAAVVLITIGLITEPLSSFQVNAATIGSIAYLSIFGTAIAFSLYFYLLKTTEATKLSMIAFITPVAALVLGIIFLGEGFTVSSLIGSLMVVGGVFIVVMGDNLWEKRLRLSD